MRYGTFVTLAAAVTFATAGPAPAQESPPPVHEPSTDVPKPGEVIGKNDVARVRGHVSPGVEWLVSRGMQMEIIENRETPDPPAYREATEKYSAQVRLTPDGTLDESTYVAGRPFPIIDPNDPHVAIKIMYNFERGRYFTDDLAVRWFDAETGSIAQRDGGQTYNIERHFVLDNLRVLRYVGRTENEPIPHMRNPDKVLQKSGQYPVIEPFDLKGVGGISYRFLEPYRHDDTWLYLPSLRRVRRLSTAQRSDALFGQDVDVDTYGGYAGKIPWFEWKLLGARPMFASGLGEDFPPVPCESDGGVTFCSTWHLRPKVWIIEGTPKLPGYAYSKRLIFMDAATFFINHTDLYDQGGELWKVAVLYGRFDKRPNPRATFEYDAARNFLYGFVMTDIQLEHSTRAALPGIGFPDEPGWYINQGEADEGWFTIGSLIESGR